MAKEEEGLVLQSSVVEPLKKEIPHLNPRTVAKVLTKVGLKVVRHGGTMAQSQTELEKRASRLEQAIEQIRHLPSSFSGREEWISPKFSVSYSRSIRNLFKQRLVAYMPTTDDNWAMFITDKGLPCSHS